MTRLTADEINHAFEHNPEAAAIAWGMSLVSESSYQTSQLMNNVHDNTLAENAKLRRQLAYWRNLGERYLAIRADLLAPLPGIEEAPL